MMGSQDVAQLTSVRLQSIYRTTVWGYSEVSQQLQG